jgi:hypothetical protein
MACCYIEVDEQTKNGYPTYINYNCEVCGGGYSPDCQLKEFELRGDIK